MAKNGTLKTLGIITGIILAIGGTIWALATQSSHLDYTRGEVVSIIKDVEVIDGRVDKVEDAVILIQSDLKHIKNDVSEQKTLSKEILRELRK